jgi:hypothetical protein
LFSVLKCFFFTILLIYHKRRSECFMNKKVRV